MNHYPSTRHWLFLITATLSIFCMQSATALDGPTPVRTLGPTGLEVELQKDNTLKVTAVQEGSPAAGKFNKGQIITAINDTTIPEGFFEHRKHLGNLITQAEARDGVLKLKTQQGDITLKIPTLGSYSDTWPLNCPKTDKIIAANASYLRGLVKSDSKGLASHSMTDALAIVSLLSTGKDEDLEVVRTIYKKRMATFKPDSIGPHSWHNGHQGIAACEYYLRTGDQSVMPLINAICDAAKRYQVHGGYYHWATAANPKYGVVNACGTNVLTTMLLAKHCGAKVDDKALMESLVYFYRFAGHGINPYGDHRPEPGLGSNGKAEQVAVAMQIASLSENGKSYVMARDKSALLPLYSYPSMFNGHTGPIGNIWYGPVAAMMIEKKPALYRNRMNEVRWFYELSRQHDGSFVMSSSRGYDNQKYGSSMLLGLTAPRKALQITGAPRSKYGVSFTLPELPWGRSADLAFFNTDGSSSYKPLAASPHLEAAKIATATKQQLQQTAGHPISAYREGVAAAIRKQGHYDLIETLLTSESPLERHTACLAINQFQPFKLRYSKGWLSEKSIDPEHFTQTMFDRLIAMVSNPKEALWLVDQSLLALAAAKPEQTLAHLDTITPWLQHAEWWFYESASLALSPALSDIQGAQTVLPVIAKAHAKMDHARARSTVEYLIDKNASSMPKEVRHLTAKVLGQAYADTPNQTWEKGSMDLSNITSVALAGTIGTILKLDPEMAPAMAELSIGRIDDLSARERRIHIDALISAAKTLDETQRKQVGKILTKHYRSAIYQEKIEELKPSYEGYVKAFITDLNTITDIDQLAGKSEGWTQIGTDSPGKQQWQFASFDAPEKIKESERERYRKVTFPKSFENWHLPDYKPSPQLWITVTADIGKAAPTTYRNQPVWESNPKQGGEVTLLRKTFEVDDIDYAMLRLVTYSRQGYRIYLNGQLVVESKGRSKNWQPRMTYPNKRGELRKVLKKGTNVLTATSFLQYFKGKDGDLEVYLEGIKELPKAN